MIQVICGEKGNGKTKEMLQKANSVLAQAQGTVVYIDKSSQHMYELSNQIRLINIKEYPVATYDSFIGFIAGLLSGNHDIECVFIDSFLKVASLDKDTVAQAIDTLDGLSNDVQFICSISLPEDELPDIVKEKIIISC